MQTVRDPSVEWVVASLAAGGFYLVAALVYPAGIGMGDVKLAAVAGAWLGPSLLAPACLASALAGLCAVAIMALRPGRKIAMNDEIPFGSFIAPVILGFWVWRVFDLVPIWLSAQP